MKKRNQISATRTEDHEPHEVFCKIMLSNFSNQLHIPHAFVENFPGVFPPKITLTTRDGKKTQVSSIKLQNNVLLKAGWSDFVKDKSISFGDFLVFQVVSDSEYNVTIFKRNGCEDRILNQKKITVIDIESDSDCTTDNHKTDKLRDNAFKVRRSMQARARAVEAANQFVSEHPFFKVRMTKAKLKSRCLYVPVGFVKQYLGKDTKDITLQMAKRSWTAGLSLRTYKGVLYHILLHRGWHDFAKDNNLRHDDICAFEFMKGTKIVLKVSIFRSIG